MANARVLGRALQAALLAALAALHPACSDGNSSTNSGGGGSTGTPLNWNSTTAGSGGTAGGANTPLYWRDPNLAPIGSTGGAVGNLTYGQAWPNIYTDPADPNYNRPVATAAPQNQGEETNIEAEVFAYRAMWLRNNNNMGGGGGAGWGGGIPINTLPNLLYSSNLRTIARARCQDWTMGNAAAGQSLANRMTAAGLQFTPGTESEAYAGGANAAAAYNSMGVQQRSLGGGWVGGGYWSPAPYWGLVFCQSGNVSGP